MQTRFFVVPAMPQKNTCMGGSGNKIPLAASNELIGRTAI